MHYRLRCLWRASRAMPVLSMAKEEFPNLWMSPWDMWHIVSQISYHWLVLIDIVFFSTGTSDASDTSGGVSSLSSGTVVKSELNSSSDKCSDMWHIVSQMRYHWLLLIDVVLFTTGTSDASDASGGGSSLSSGTVVKPELNSSSDKCSDLWHVVSQIR